MESPGTRIGLVFGAAVALAGCGDDKSGARVGLEPDHASEVARDPYALTCEDIARQPENSERQRLVINAEFALAKEPVLRERVTEMTENRVGRSVYWALTEMCKGRDESFKPAHDAVEAVRRGRYLVQPRPESWSKPELWSQP